MLPSAVAGQQDSQLVLRLLESFLLMEVFIDGQSGVRKHLPIESCFISIVRLLSAETSPWSLLAFLVRCLLHQSLLTSFHPWFWPPIPCLFWKQCSWPLLVTNFFSSGISCLLNFSAWVLTMSPERGVPLDCSWENHWKMVLIICWSACVLPF